MYRVLNVSILCFLLCFYTCNAAHVKNDVEGRANAEDCEDSMSFECLKIKLVDNVIHLLRTRSFKIADYMTVEQIKGTENSRSGKAALDYTLPKDAERKDEKLDSLLEDGISQLMESRSLKLNLDAFIPGAAVRVTKATNGAFGLNIGLDMPEGGRDIGEGRVGPLRIRRFLPFLLLFKSSFFGLGILTIIGISLLAGKALLVSKLALLLASVIGLKKLFGNNHGPAVEVVSHPHYNHHESYGPDSYAQGRTYEAESQKAFRGQ